MKIPRTHIAKIIAGRTLKGGVSKKYAREIAAYLLAERRTQELDSMLRDVLVNWAEAGQVEVAAHSAHPLTADIKAEIIRRVKNLYPAAQTISVSEKHDPDLIGGVRIALPDQQLDLSIEAKLNKFKQLATAGRV